MNAIFIASCIVLMVIPVIFVVHQVYEDGLIGRVGLLGISFSAFVSLGECIVGGGFQVPPAVVMIVAFAAVFLCWHLFRFHRRVLRRDTYVVDARGADAAGIKRLSEEMMRQGRKP